MSFNRTINVGQLMTTDLSTLGPDDNLIKVDKLFRTHDFHHIPIVDKAGRILGIISRGDFYKMEDSFTVFNTVKSRQTNAGLFQSTLTQEIMSKQLVTLQPTDTAITAMGMFKENLFHALPIVEANNKLVGLLTTYDLLTYAYNEPVYIAEAEK